MVESARAVETRLIVSPWGMEVDEGAVAILGSETPVGFGCGLRGVIGVSSSKEGRRIPGLGSGEVVFKWRVGFVSVDGGGDGGNASIIFRSVISFGG